MDKEQYKELIHKFELFNKTYTEYTKLISSAEILYLTTLNLSHLNVLEKLKDKFLSEIGEQIKSIKKIVEEIIND